MNKFITSSLLSLLIIITGLMANPSLSEMNRELRTELLNDYKGEDIENYAELLKMIELIPGDENAKAVWNSKDYINVRTDETGNSDEFFARILYPYKRKSEEYSNWITSIYLNPKAVMILMKAHVNMSSIKDLVYILKKTRPGISEHQLYGLLKRKHLIKNPLIINDCVLPTNFNLSDYTVIISIHCFLATMKRPFTEQNIRLAKETLLGAGGIALGIGVATITAYTTQAARDSASKRK